MLPASPFLYKKDLDSASINKPHQATTTPSSSFFLSVSQTQHNQRTDTHKGTNKQTRLETEMESSDTYTPTSSAPLSHSPTSSSSSPPPPPPPTVVMSPCAACKILRRRCAEKCVLAPYFPPTEPAKFTIAHRVFGASNIIKFLQELPESQRADAVTSMVYEASARIRDPVYGCAGAICQLQKQVNELQAQLAKSQAELVTMQLQQANLVALICMEMAQSPQESPQQSVDNFISTPPHTGGYQSGMNNFFEENTSPNALWEPLWT